MAMKVKVKIQNLDKEVEIDLGDDLRTGLMENKVDVYDGNPIIPLPIPGNVALRSPLPWSLVNCQGHGLCGSCLVDVAEGAEGLSDATSYERARARFFNWLRVKYDKKPKLANPRLACLTRCYRDTVIRTMPGPAAGE